MIFSSCSESTSSHINNYTYVEPDTLGDGWSVSSLDAEGMDTETIEVLTGKLIRGEFRGIHSLIIVKNGKLVHEVYLNGLSATDLQTTFSVTKSISSALIGVAIDRGYIRSLEDTVLSYFPQYNIDEQDKLKIKLHHILTLTTGLLWDEKTYPYSDSRNTETQMLDENDWMKFVLERPMDSEPGSDWVYNTGSVHLLSGIIKYASGLYADIFAEQFLFRPLGINAYEWNKDPKGYPCTGATLQGLKLSARDMAKFGYLYMNKGEWKNNQIIPKAWVDESLQAHVDNGDQRQFGYLWWLGSYTLNGKEYDHFYATGYGGQTIHCVPELDLVIVLTCWGEPEDADIGLPILIVYSAVD